MFPTSSVQCQVPCLLIITYLVYSVNYLLSSRRTHQIGEYDIRLWFTITTFVTCMSHVEAFVTGIKI